MIAYHFPPLAGSSGIQRTISFARHLPRFGWEPLILTAHPRAYERVSQDQLGDLPQDTIVERAFALDASRHLAVMGRYPGFTARPDRWVSWWLGAVPKGLAMIKTYRPHAVWSTYPIATAHVIGDTLHRLSGLPWVADFRDPMAQDGYPADPQIWRSFKRIEETAVRRASFCVFAAPGAARMYRERYGDAPGARFAVIENGYDEESFAPYGNALRDKGPLLPGKFTLIHSGIVYPSERDPTQLFQALRQMLDDGRLKPGELRVRLRAPAHEGFLRKLIEDIRVGEIVEIAPPLPYREALEEMLRADGLLVLQASNCNDQIPAKAYEYLRCRRPILALTDPAGDTARLLEGAGSRSIARLDSMEDIASGLRRFLDSARRGEAAPPSEAFVAGASRLHRAQELSELLARLPR
jgi:glycosyltransferase involved in cell wall biosynthesis